MRGEPGDAPKVGAAQGMEVGHPQLHLFGPIASSASHGARGHF